MRMAMVDPLCCTKIGLPVKINCGEKELEDTMMLSHALQVCVVYVCVYVYMCMWLPVKINCGERELEDTMMLSHALQVCVVYVCVCVCVYVHVASGQN